MSNKEGFSLVRQTRVDGVVQGYWKSTADLKSAVEKGGGAFSASRDVAVGIGADPEVVNGFMDGMSGWSNHPGSGESLRMRGAAAAIAAKSSGGDEEKAIQQEIERATHVSGSPERAIREGSASSQHQNTLEALAAVSQAMHPEDSIKLYRGLGRKQFKEAVEKGYVDTGALCSFSESARIARDFAKTGKGGVISIDVPRGAIAVSWRAFRKEGPFANALGLRRDEKEIVVMTTGRLRIKAE